MEIPTAILKKLPVFLRRKGCTYDSLMRDIAMLDDRSREEVKVILEREMELQIPEVDFVKSEEEEALWGTHTLEDESRGSPKVNTPSPTPTIML